MNNICDSKLYGSSLMHYGITGMKWGHRKRYIPTSIGAWKARRENKKIDESFRKWKESDAHRDNAIKLGKKANESRMTYLSNKGDKNAKVDYKKDYKAYKKEYNKNTTYRKGVVKQEVKADSSRKYLSKAKALEKKLASNPNDIKMQKEYNWLMNKHDIERSKARKAPKIAERRSKAKASVKRSTTIAVKTAATSAVVAAGAMAANKILSKQGIKINIGMPTIDFKKYADIGKKLFM